MNERAKAFRDAAAICRRYSENLSELPREKEGALECAAILDEAAELAPTAAQNGDGSCQELLEILFE